LMAKKQPRRMFVAGMAALASAGRIADAQDRSPSVIRLASSVSDDVTPLLYAQASGMLPHYDLNVELDKVNSGSAVVAGVAGGAYEIGKSNVVPLINAHVKGVPFVLIAPGGVYNSAAPVTALLTGSASSIKSAKDLNGKVVAVSALWDLYSLSIRNWIDSHGGDSTTLKFLELPAVAVPAALETGRVDAAALEEPHLSEALQSAKVRVVAHIHDSIARQFMLTAWFTKLDYAQRNEPALTKFRSMIKSASSYANAHHPATVNLIAAFALVKPAVITSGTRVTWGSDLDPKLVQPVIDLCAKYKTIPQRFDAREMLDPALIVGPGT
jgi:NitT/TauT family transport system substrate-binding protein